ncbi:hypothetical protein PISMIDRAFT_249307 [Pisolithus microcarpus 441]|uniref:Uncharacterized protein n=1 Tax=Pisolithus microcarpus 441 TaxID=765257 RepID=A0A0C9XWN1_9AGAM|nr:hypothetical protein PISMIDRAFT_249307 [Pisolithus microcarpus 441]
MTGIMSFFTVCGFKNLKTPRHATAWPPLPYVVPGGNTVNTNILFLTTGTYLIWYHIRSNSSLHVETHSPLREGRHSTS